MYSLFFGFKFLSHFFQKFQKGFRFSYTTDRIYFLRTLNYVWKPIIRRLPNFFFLALAFLKHLAYCINHPYFLLYENNCLSQTVPPNLSYSPSLSFSFVSLNGSGGYNTGPHPHTIWVPQLCFWKFLVLLEKKKKSYWTINNRIIIE